MRFRGFRGSGCGLGVLGRVQGSVLEVDGFGVCGLGFSVSDVDDDLLARSDADPRP